MIAKIFINAFREAIRSACLFDQEMAFVSKHQASYTLGSSDPKIEEIVKHTPLSYNEAKDIYNLSQDHDIPLDALILVSCRLGGNQRAVNLLKEGMTHEPRRH